MTFPLLLTSCWAVLHGLFTAAPDPTPTAALPPLYPYTAADARWGYLDAAGCPVVPARFQTAQLFSEGVAAVRENGYYGYIAPDGKFVVPARYDYATPFRGSYALVWQAGKPLVLNRAGQLMFTHSYAAVELCYGGGRQPYCRVTTRSQRQGITDVRGRLLVDTVFRSIRPYYHGVAVVRGLRDGTQQPDPAHPGDSIQVREVGVIDVTGRMVVPLGKYRQIEDFTAGYSSATLPYEQAAGLWANDEVVLDSTGRACFTVPATSWKFAQSSLRYDEKVAPVEVYRHRPERGSQRSARRRQTFASLVDEQGRLLFRNEKIEEILPLASGRTFGRTQDQQWHLLNRQGRFVTAESYPEVVGNSPYQSEGPAFQQGVAFVRDAQNRLLGLDTAGRVVMPARSFGFGYTKVFRQGELLVFQQDSMREDGTELPTRYGFWHPKRNVLVPPRYQALFPVADALPDDLLVARQDSRWSYLTQAGELIWQQPATNQSLASLDIDYMRRATYTVASPPTARSAEEPGGWGGSDNMLRSAQHGQFPANQLQLTVDTQPTAGLFQQQAAGHRLYLVNTTSDTITFRAQDSMLYLSLEAQDEQGQWQAIEYVPSSWCGNSYHTVFLAPNQYWQLVVPSYQGARPTRLRARLQVQGANAETNQPAHILYSNEFDGSVNPAQFWRQLEYQSASIMDPYRN
ncbi:WG repeat-containing protein [Hymenobacter sp. HSC-4F20]|uniref:WG repeat-containing protein n=1 Tax=Hymenobacter sp. HSC-4F20 TaxID=2864135 RepID=UPI001C73C961|nr:WG repeat-containing protein [Hymenobacter sp. HSC-4F20]MBX0289030.1 WG repeat-containing protein [Hymenobacter sp. HSC-4F20]